MNQFQRRIYLIDRLLDENPDYRNMQIPGDAPSQKRMLRSLMNVRFAAPISAEFEQIQNEYLTEENNAKGIVAIDDIDELEPQIYLWQGDITRLATGAIVNAANSGMTGCYQPCHNCIDNCIHTYAGIQLRNLCSDIMTEQGHEELTGQAKITPAFNLPSDYVIHTVGPIVMGRLTSHDEELLRSCYLSCLKIADENNVGSIAFCCISTGVFGYPKDKAAETAVKTVKEYLQETGSSIQVVFNVFGDEDLDIYKGILVG